MGRDLNELASYFLPLAQALIENADAAGLDVIVVTTGRTAFEQEQKIAEGVSWTSHSKHEPQPPEGKSEAIDLAPRALTLQKGWAPGDPLWQQLGAIGKKLGLAWGGDWKHVNGGFGDPSHFQYVHPVASTTMEEA